MDSNEQNGWYVLNVRQRTFTGPYRTILEIARKCPEALQAGAEDEYLIVRKDPDWE